MLLPKQTRKVVNSIIRWHQENCTPCSYFRMQAELYVLDEAFLDTFKYKCIDGQFVNWGQGPMVNELTRYFFLYDDLRGVTVGEDVALFCLDEQDMFNEVMDWCSKQSDRELKDIVETRWLEKHVNEFPHAPRTKYESRA